MSYLKVGDRVRTKFGLGTVLGFEILGSSRPTFIHETDVEPGSRVLVQLDDPSQWILTSEHQPHPYMMRRDLS